MRIFQKLRESTGVLVLGLVLAAAGAACAAPPANLQSFLRDVIGFQGDDFAAVESGKVVTRLLPKTDTGEIAAFGVAKVRADAASFERLAGDVERFRRMEGIVEMGVFSEPAAMGDLAELTIPPDDIDALKKCKTGSCDVKLTEAALERVAGFDWSAPEAPAQAARVFKEMALHLVGAYRTGGTDAIGTMIDKKDPKSRSGEFHRLLANAPYLFKYVREFHDCLEAYPAKPLPDARNVIYWTRDTFGPKPVISLLHGTVVRRDDAVLVATKLLAATHFFNAGLDVCVGVPASGAPETYLVDVYRVRIDPPTGMMAGPAMKRVEKGIEEGVSKSLAGMQAKLK
jgi:hypothetical protein